MAQVRETRLSQEKACRIWARSDWWGDDMDGEVRETNSARSWRRKWVVWLDGKIGCGSEGTYVLWQLRQKPRD